MAEENNTPQDESEGAPAEAATSEDVAATEAADTSSETQADASATDTSTMEDAATESTDNAIQDQDNSPVGTVIVPQPELSAALSSSPESDEPRREVEGGRSYEIIFITRAGDPEATDTANNRLRELIEGQGGAIDNVRTSETRRLAYTIGKEIEGIYTVVNTRFTTEHMQEIDRFFKLEEAVLRHMILREEA